MLRFCQEKLQQLAFASNASCGKQSAASRQRNATPRLCYVTTMTNGDKANAEAGNRERHRVRNGKTFGALATLAALVAVPYVIPVWEPAAPLIKRLQVLHPVADESIETQPSTVPAPIDSVGHVDVSDITDSPLDNAVLPSTGNFSQLTAPPHQPDTDLSTDAPRGIDDPTARALNRFYKALQATEATATGAHARVLYYGDSVVAADGVTSTLRHRLQKRFGDAGHGFILLANAWPGYVHENVSRVAGSGWKVSRLVGPYSEDGFYGLGGVSFVADTMGSFARITTVSSRRAEGAVGRFVVSYAKQPRGGDLALMLDGKTSTTLSTRAETLQTATAAVETEDGAHSLEVRSLGKGPVRVFGVDLERTRSGVLVDALGIVGCRFRFLDKSDDAHWAEQLAQRSPSLLVFAFGANESEDGFAYPINEYEQSAKAVLQQVRRAVPDAACLLVGPLDRVDKKGSRFVTRSIIPALNEAQRRLAIDSGCGFFDTFQAMGGAGSMGRWYLKGWGSSDFIHPTVVGADKLGTWLYNALLQGYETYQPSER